MIELYDITGGRVAPCRVLGHGASAACEIVFDSLIDWARKARRLCALRRAIKKGRFLAEFQLVTPSEFACGLYISDENGARLDWVADDWTNAETAARRSRGVRLFPRLMKARRQQKGPSHENILRDQTCKR